MKRSNSISLKLFLGLSLFFYFSFGALADQCINCHSDPDFRVSDKKLFDYYQNWSNSIHALAKVSCIDCHGGDSDSADMSTAHCTSTGKTVSTAVDLANIPETCGECHQAVYAEFRKSKHFKALKKDIDGIHGPNCVTCHGSLNAQSIKTDDVAKVCQQCHNSELIKSDDVALRAEELMSDFISINRFFKYVSRKGTQEQIMTLRKKVSPRLDNLITHWHQFELDAIELETKEILGYLKNEKSIVQKQRRLNSR
jgi:formate-dependent nitrite reductase cytochrome c552 subunit